MKTRACGLLLGVAASFAFCATSFAQMKEDVHNFNFALEYSDYEYKEPSLMKLTGKMQGFTAQYLNNAGVGRINNTTSILLGARLNYMYDKLDYDGHLQDSMTGTLVPYKDSGQKSYFVDTAITGGLKFKLNEKMSVSPYTGLGYRFLEHKHGVKYFAPLNVDVTAVKREQTYYYLPLGADFKMSLAPGWGLALNAEFDILLRGENTTTHKYMGEKDKREHRQKSGYGLRTSVKVEKDFMAAGVFVEPFYRYWDIKKSNEDCGYDNIFGVYNCSWEPKNKTNEFGLRIGASF